MKCNDLTRNLFVALTILFVLVSCNSAKQGISSRKISCRVTAKDLSTKGTDVNTTNLNVKNNTFILNGFLEKTGRSVEDSTDPRFMNNVTYACGGSSWSASEDCYWRDYVVSNFWAYYPVSINGTRAISFPDAKTASGSDESQRSLSFSYTMPAPTGLANDASNQEDILFAYAQKKYQSSLLSSGEINLIFTHALSLVDFKSVGIEEHFGIENITLKSVKNKGTCTVSGISSTSGYDGDTSYDWTVAGDAVSCDYTQAVNLSAPIADDTIIPSDENHFFIVPQKGTLSISIDFKCNGVTKTEEVPLKEDYEYEAGKKYRYKVKFDGDSLTVSLDKVDDWYGEDIDADFTCEAKLDTVTVFQDKLLNDLGLDYTTIKHVAFKANCPAPAASSSVTTVSTDDSTEKLYLEFKNDTLYFKTPAPCIIANDTMEDYFKGFIEMQDIDFSGLVTSDVKSMASLLGGCEKLTKIDGIDGFDTKNVISMRSMFYGCKLLESIDISNFNTPKLDTLNQMFYQCQALKSIKFGGGFTAENAYSMRSLFYECYKLESLDLSGFRASSVVYMEQMFVACRSLKSLNLESFNTSNVVNMQHMFYDCENLESIKFGDGFETGSVTNMLSMFACCYKLASLDLSGFDTQNVTSMRNMFYSCRTFSSLDISNFDTSNVSDFSQMFYECKDLTTLTLGDGFTADSAVTTEKMFYYCNNLKSLKLSHFASSDALINTRQMFKECIALNTLTLSDDFTTAKDTSMFEMFCNCKLLKSLDISHFETGEVTTMHSMFYECNNLKDLDFSGFNTTKVTDMESMLSHCSSISQLDLSSFRLDNCTTIEQMLTVCNNLKKLNLGSANFDSSTITNTTDFITLTPYSTAEGKAKVWCTDGVFNTFFAPTGRWEKGAGTF